MGRVLATTTPTKASAQNGYIDRTRRYFLSDLQTLPNEDGYRYEIIAGELIVTPAPGRVHGVAVDRISEQIRQILKNKSQWSMIPQPINLEIETDKTTIHCEPDMSIFDHPIESVMADETIFPVIVIEIVSPGNPDNDYVRKVGAYAMLGIPEYWIVDPRHQTVTFLALAENAYHQFDRSALLPELELATDQLFVGMP
jgi:Uma2 family endonuclease